MASHLTQVSFTVNKLRYSSKVIYGNRRHKCLVLGHEEIYYVKEHSDSQSQYSEDDIIKMLE